MEAIVLAGGMGTRLKAVVADLPKPMAPVNNKPFLEYLLNWLVRYPINRILLSVGYKAETISDYFGERFKNVPITYVVEEKPLGTGGAIKYALSFASDTEILIINADTYFPIAIDEFAGFHRSAKAKLSLALKKMEKFDRYGTVELVDATILHFNEKKFCEEGLINGGIYLADPAFINSLTLPDVFSFEKEVLENQAEKGTLKGTIFNVPFIDIGIPEDYYRASEVV